MIIAVDVDGVVADLHPAWLDWYNRDWQDNLTIDKITQWDICNFVKQECGLKMLEYLHEPTLYDTVRPVEDSLEAIDWLKNDGNRVVFASSCVTGSCGAKLKWLRKYGFVSYDPEVSMCHDWIDISDKSLVRADVLIDDRPKNVNNFHGIGVIFDQPYNQNKNEVFADFRLKNWRDIKSLMGKIQETVEC